MYLLFWQTGEVMKKYKSRKNLELFVFLSLIFVTYLVWAVTAPFNGSPDEHMRYQIVEFIVKHGMLPDGRDPEIRNANWGISYAFNPILPYIAGAVFAKITSFFTESFQATVIAARMVNVFLGTGTAFFTWKIGERLFSRREAGKLFAVLVCFLPGTCFLFSYINTDGLALFTTAWILYCWCRSCQEGWSLTICIQLGLAMGLCMLSYYNAYGWLLMSAVFFVGAMMKCQEKAWDYQQMLKKGFLMLGIVFLVAGWWFIRSAILYDGDFLGMKTSSIYAELYAIDELKPSNRVLPQDMGMSVWDMMLWIPGEWQHNWLLTVAVSFVGTFGYLDIFMPYSWSKGYLLVFLLGGFGILWNLRNEFLCNGKWVGKEKNKTKEEIIVVKTTKRKRRWDAEKWMHLCMAASMVFPPMLLTYYSYTSDFQAQGRYIMPLLLPFMYFVMVGYEYWINKFIKNEKVIVWSYRMVTLLYVISEMCVYFLVFRAAYAG